MFNSNSFSERLKSARSKKHLSQAELAKAIGVSAATISSYETPNGTKIPALDKAAALADELEVSLDWLCGKDSKEKVEITDFDAETYLRALVVVTTEMSNTFEEYPQTKRGSISISNGNVVYFIKQCLDVLKVYHNGTLSRELYETCIEKIISNYAGYVFEYDNFLTESEALSIHLSLLNLNDIYCEEGGLKAPSVVQVGVDSQYTSTERTVNAFVSEKALKDLLPKGGD
ncbi:MAG: helix-turn-helix transcriptional regulator [Oscillospiraceae bacterium]|nr:helix-turn-helix transcriptional regulator [Oscillospiraceae bacterium]